MSELIRAAADRLLYDASHLLRLVEQAETWPSAPRDWEPAVWRAVEALASLESPQAPRPGGSPGEALRGARAVAYGWLASLASLPHPPALDLGRTFEALAEAGLAVAARHPALQHDALARDWLRWLPLPERLEGQRRRVLRGARLWTRRLRALR